MDLSHHSTRKRSILQINKRHISYTSKDNPPFPVWNPLQKFFQRAFYLQAVEVKVIMRKKLALRKLKMLTAMRLLWWWWWWWGWWGGWGWWRWRVGWWWWWWWWWWLWWWPMAPDRNTWRHTLRSVQSSPGQSFLIPYLLTFLLPSYKRHFLQIRL